MLGIVDPITRRVPVEAVLDNGGRAALRAGSFVRARALGGDSIPVLRLPHEVLRPGSQDEVFVDRDGVLDGRHIVFSVAADGALLVRRGITENDRVIVAVTAEMKTGDRVRGRTLADFAMNRWLNATQRRADAELRADAESRQPRNGPHTPGKAGRPFFDIRNLSIAIPKKSMTFKLVSPTPWCALLLYSGIATAQSLAPSNERATAAVPRAGATPTEGATREAPVGSIALSFEAELRNMQRGNGLTSVQVALRAVSKSARIDAKRRSLEAAEAERQSKRSRVSPRAQPERCAIRGSRTSTRHRSQTWATAASS